MSPFREYPGAFDEEVDHPPRERARKGGGNGGNGDGSGQDGGQQWPQPKPLPAGLAPVERFSSNFCPMRWRHGLTTSRTDCNARQIT
jgi:hypothetical protein